MRLLPPAFVSELLHLPRGVWVLVGGQFINRFGSFVYPFLALILAQRGYSLADISLVLGGLAAGQVVAPFVGGYLADALGRRDTIVLSLVGGALTMVGLYAGRSPLALATMAVAHGFFANMFGPAANALLSDLVLPPQRVSAYALLRLAINAGFSAGPAIGGVLFGIAPVLLFWGDAATTLVFASLALLFLPHGLRSIRGSLVSPRVVAQSWLEAGRDAWRNGPFVQLFGGTLLMAVGFIQVFTVLSLHATAHGVTTKAYGLVMGLNGLLILLFELPLAHLVKRYEARRVLVTGFVMTGLGVAAFGAARDVPQLLMAMALFTLGEMISLPIAAGYASELAPAALRGRYFGLFGTVWGLAGLAGSCGPWLYGQLGSWWWLLAGLAGVAGGIAMAWRWRDRRGVMALTASLAK